MVEVGPSSGSSPGINLHTIENSRLFSTSAQEVLDLPASYAVLCKVLPKPCNLKEKEEGGEKENPQQMLPIKNFNYVPEPLLEQQRIECTSYLPT